MAGLGRKTFSPGDVLTSSDVQGYLMDQSVMVFAGTAARASAIPSPSAGMVAYSTATALQVYNGSAWVDASTGYGVATGGSSSSITVGGVNYTLLTFSSDATLTITRSGLFDCLILGGGGGAYRWDSGAHGGGAGGGIVQQTIYLSANQSVVVGAGGAAGAQLLRAYGNPSSIGTASPAISAIGGQVQLADGGLISIGNLGSLSGCIAAATAGGTNNVQGNKGGSSVIAAGGGGGGFGGVGGNGTGTTGGAGGAGYDVSAFIGGSALFKASGGGGGGSVTGGAAGSSLGNAGTTSTGNTPAANTAAGGGGGYLANAGGSGASGIVYVRFKV